MTCAIEALAHGVDTMIEVPILATPDGKPGASAPFSLSVLPDSGLDAKPDDNVLDAAIRFTGIAVLDDSLTPSTSRTTVGTTIHVTTSIRNDGPQPAEEAVGLALTSNATFAIAGFSGNTEPPAGLALQARSAMRAVSASDPSDTPPTTDTGPASDPSAVIGFVGTIPAPTSTTATLDLKAVAVGTAQLAFVGGSTAGDPGCDNPTSDTSCHEFTQITLTSVAAPVRTTPATSAMPPASPAPPAATSSVTPSYTATSLANTDEPVREMLVAELLALLAGLTLTVAGRRLRPARQERLRD